LWVVRGGGGGAEPETLLTQDINTGLYRNYVASEVDVNVATNNTGKEKARRGSDGKRRDKNVVTNNLKLVPVQIMSSIRNLI
jgi:hypothetical protein